MARSSKAVGCKTMSALVLKNIGHAFLGRTVLNSINLSVATSEIVALVGPSGCGKSTLIHIASGIIEQIQGSVEHGYNRHGMVFQDTRLLPWANARDNIAYPLRIAGIGKTERRKLAEKAAEQVSLEQIDLDKYPVELSGGMRQRVSIARALVMEPDFIYFDEPFTALDVALKRRMQDLLIASAQTSRFAGLFVTHDLMEATRIAHRIIVLDVYGNSIIGQRPIPGEPGTRSDIEVFTRVQEFLHDDPLFRHIHDVDERIVA